MITHAQLLELLRYEPDIGEFFWRVDCGKFRAGQAAGRLQPASPYKYRNGSSIPYWLIPILGTSHFRGKLAWFYMTGEYPKMQIDHRDADSLNDRWGNLREATQALNNANRRAFQNNRLGQKGVHPVGEKYRAMISVDGKNRHLGYFDTLETARSAYEMAASEAFGEFARTA